jgi:hypothetical protein
MKKLKLFLMLTMIAALSTLSHASGPLTCGPNCGQVTVTNTSSVITPFPNPARTTISLLNTGLVTAYVCSATQRNTLTLITCTTSIADIVIVAGASYTTETNGYAGQFTAITSSSTTTLVITEN